MERTESSLSDPNGRPPPRVQKISMEISKDLDVNQPKISMGGDEVSMKGKGPGPVLSVSKRGDGGAQAAWRRKGATREEENVEAIVSDGAQSLRASFVARHSCRGVEGDRVIAARKRNLVLVLYCGLQNHSSRSKSNGTGHPKHLLLYVEDGYDRTSN